MRHVNCSTVHANPAPERSLRCLPVLTITLLLLLAVPGLGSDTYGALPLSFEENRGQADPSVRYLARGPGYVVFLTADEMIVKLNQPLPERERIRSAHNRTELVAGLNEADFVVVRTKLPGARSNPVSSAVAELPGKSNYFIGNNPARWRAGVPAFAGVRYSEVYPGVDLTYYGNQRQLEYDFVVAPGADPSVIEIGYEGVEDIIRDDSGDLLLRTSSGILGQHTPKLYQEIGGVRQPVTGRYIVSRDRQVRFQVDHYDTRRALVIDPVLSYATFVGGSSSDAGFALALDKAGNAYITGATSSVDLPVGAGAFQGARRSATDAFVIKVNAAGTAVSYATYLGGDDNDYGMTIAVDASGNAYVGGYTISTSFPTTPGAFQTSTSDSCCQDGFVAKLNAAGSALAYSTYVAGLDHDSVDAIAVDPTGSVYLTGRTKSARIAPAIGFQSANKGNGDGYVAKLNGSGSGIEYFTFLGGAGSDEPLGIALDLGGNVYVTGSTTSSDFPVTSGAYQRSSAGGGDAFITKLGPALSLIYSTYLGGGGDDAAWQVSSTPSGAVYVAGRTGSSNFPATSNALQAGNKGGANDAFLAKLDATGSSVVYATYLGGSGDDWVYGMAIDAMENVYLVGRTDSTNFPVSRDAIQSTIGGARDMFVVKLGPGGTTLQYSTYLGGTGIDDAFSTAVDSQGRVVLTGQTASPNFPTSSGALQSRLSGTMDAILVRLDLNSNTAAPPSSLSIVSGNNQSGAQGTLLGSPLVVALKDSAGNPSVDVAVTFTGTNASANPASVRTDTAGRASTVVTLGSNVGAATITASAANVPSVTASFTAAAVPLPSPAALSILSGNNQSGAPRAVLGSPLVVAVRDSAGNPSGDVAVSFAGTNASANPASVRSDTSGRVSTVVTLGQNTGPATIIASALSVPTATANFTVVAAVPPQIPVISRNGVVNGASNVPGVGSGSWITIYGSNLSSTTRTWGSGDFQANRLPVILDGVSVTVNNRDALIYFVSPTQLNVLHNDDTGTGTVNVVVSNARGTSAPVQANLQRYAPGLFTFGAQNNT